MLWFFTVSCILSTQCKVLVDYGGLHVGLMKQIEFILYTEEISLDVGIVVIIAIEFDCMYPSRQSAA